jgi:hypothetical protein
MRIVDQMAEGVDARVRLALLDLLSDQLDSAGNAKAEAGILSDSNLHYTS